MVTFADGSAFGGFGDDTLADGSGYATLRGDAGRDLFSDGDEAGVLFGGIVSDTEGSSDQVFASVRFVLGEGREWLTIEAEADVARSGTGNDADDRIIGHDGADVLSALGGGDSVLGWAGETLVLGNLDGDAVADFTLRLSGSIALEAYDFAL